MERRLLIPVIALLAALGLGAAIVLTHQDRHPSVLSPPVASTESVPVATTAMPTATSTPNSTAPTTTVSSATQPPAPAQTITSPRPDNTPTLEATLYLTALRNQDAKLFCQLLSPVAVVELTAPTAGLSCEQAAFPQHQHHTLVDSNAGRSCSGESGQGLDGEDFCVSLDHGPEVKTRVWFVPVAGNWRIAHLTNLYFAVARGQAFSAGDPLDSFQLALQSYLSRLAQLPSGSSQPITLTIPRTIGAAQECVSSPVGDALDDTTIGASGTPIHNMPTADMHAVQVAIRNGLVCVNAQFSAATNARFAVLIGQYSGGRVVVNKVVRVLSPGGTYTIAARDLRQQYPVDTLVPGDFGYSGATVSLLLPLAPLGLNGTEVLVSVVACVVAGQQEACDRAPDSAQGEVFFNADGQPITPKVIVGRTLTQP
jgi:hypothetical protein